ncbi:MAG: aminodeoxychorismate lyase [Bacteroidia bacterium]|nr:aminodeoxychorismate lyase [Methylotenera sp.]
MAIEHNYLVNGYFNQAISPFDRGFAYGDGIFRTLKMANGLPKHWPQHYQKLVADCAVIGIVCPSAELLMNDLQQLFTIDEIAVAKIMITRGESEQGYAPPAITTPMRVIVKSAMRQYAETNYTEGVHLHVCETRLGVQAKLAGIKHLNRLENVMARMEWKDDTYFDGLMLNQQNDVIECTMSNIFARFNDKLLTPDLSQCGVAGITRQGIIGLAAALNISIETAQLPLNRLVEADEIIVCNSLYGAFQVHSILNTSWKPQTLAKKIRNLLTYD